MPSAVKRFLPYVLAAVLGATATYFLVPRPETSDVVTAKLTTCESSLSIEQGANNRLAKQLNDADRKCDDRVDQMLAARKLAEKP